MHPADAYYRLLDADDPQGEKFAATDLVRGTWSARIQHAAPVSALLVRALEHHEAREDTRLSRVAVDLWGPVPADGPLWVRARVDRPGKQIELLGADMLALGPDEQVRRVARATGWRLQTSDTADVAHASAPPLRPGSEARANTMHENWDRSYVHSLDWRWLTTTLAPPAGPRCRRALDHADRRPGRRGDDATAAAAVRRRRRRQRRRHQTRHHRVDVPQHRSRRPRAPHSRRAVDRDPRRDQLRRRRDRDDHRHPLRRARCGGRHPAVGTGASTVTETPKPTWPASPIGKVPV